jgi:hypothetical protein
MYPSRAGFVFAAKRVTSARFVSKSCSSCNPALWRALGGLAIDICRYLRLLEAKAPAIYGPSAEEWH